MGESVWGKPLWRRLGSSPFKKSRECAALNAGIIHQEGDVRTRREDRKLPFEWRIHPKPVEGLRSLMKKAFSALTTATAVAALAYAGYVILTSLPDLRRYIRISTM
jgi:hypothetical protein